MGEFELIRRYFAPMASASKPASDGSGLLLGVGDDCAIQRLPANQDLVFSVDTLVEGVHFPVGYCSQLLGWRSLAVAVSDLAAMGAQPVCFTLALTLPAADDAWLEGFAAGLAQASQKFGIVLAGGDTTRGPLTLSLQVHGTVPQGQALRRDGARDGDLVCVSGQLGDAGAALDFLYDTAPATEAASVLQSYHYPQPRLELGIALRSVASAAIDVSDGLHADLLHILQASGVGATIDLAALPLSAALRQLKGDDAAGFALQSGDDYELCITIPEQRWVEAGHELQQQLTVIGRVQQEAGLRLNADAGMVYLQRPGFDHFSIT
jgi:thiamine-monophosphate kinase